MADASAGALVRVTVASGTRRVDLALPGSVPVAELVPELARSVGVLDPRTVHGGYQLVGVDGRMLVAGAGLHDQGVVDGSVLTVTSGLAVPTPRRYDDAAEALADAVESDVAPWRADQSRAVGVVAAGILFGVAVGFVMPIVERGIALPLTMILVAAVLAGGLFPRWAFSVSGVGARARTSPVDAAAVAADARLAHRILAGMAVVVGVLLITVAPLTAGMGGWAIGLVSAAACALLLGSVRQRAAVRAMTGVACGLGGLAGVAVTVLRSHPVWRPEVAAAMLALACCALLAGAPAVSSSLRWGRLADLAESAALVSLLPLLVVLSGVLDHLPVIGG